MLSFVGFCLCLSACVCSCHPEVVSDANSRAVLQLAGSTNYTETDPCVDPPSFLCARAPNRGGNGGQGREPSHRATKFLARQGNSLRDNAGKTPAMLQGKEFPWRAGPPPTSDANYWALLQLADSTNHTETRPKLRSGGMGGEDLAKP